MNLLTVCPNCNGKKTVEAKDILDVVTTQICHNCYRSDGKVPSPEGLELLAFIKQFSNWHPWKIINGIQVFEEEL